VVSYKRAQRVRIASTGSRQKLQKSLVDLLEGGFALGIATGRGKSVREALWAALPKRLWPLVAVAFYNGAIVSPLRQSE
jgi:hypothetical protein